MKTKVNDFFADSPTKRLGKGQSLYRPGDTVDKVYYLVEGTVTQYDISPVGNIVILNVFKPGAFFPTSCILNNKPADYFFEAGSPALVKWSPAARVVEFLETNPDVTLDLLKRVYSGTDGILKRMSLLMGGSAIARLTYELIISAHRFGETASNGKVILALSENDLSKRSGLSRETVNRMMRQLKDSGIVTLKSGKLEISSIKDLETTLDVL